MSRHFTQQGTCRQTFEITADIEPLIEYLTNQILDSVASKDMDMDLDEYFIDNDRLVIIGSYDTPYTWTHYDATREEPAENDIDRDYLGDPKLLLPELLKSLIKNISVEEDEDKAEYRN